MEETHIIENKKNWRDEWLQWICGFSNAQGGIVNIGLDDHGNPVGLEKIKKLMEDIPNKIISKLGIVPDVNQLQKDGLDYIEIVVKSSNVPILLDGVCYYRSGATNQILKGDALHSFVLKKMGLSWDDIPIDNATIEKDIDRNAIEFFIRKVQKSGRIPGISIEDSTEHVLENLNLITTDGKLKNAAILLFGNKPEKFFVGNSFKIGRFVSDESDLIIQDMIGGNLIQMTDKVIEALMSKYLVFHISYEGLQRIETLEIPEQALRELIYNAICHKAYPGDQIQMKIFNDRISIYNYGSLPEGYTIEKLLQEHSSRQRNQNIARVFYYAGFIEAWGRGFRKVRSEFEKAGLEQPLYEEIFGGFRVSIKRHNTDALFGKHIPLERHDVPLDVVLENADNKDDNVVERHNVVLDGVLEGAIEHQIYHLIKRTPSITIKQLSKELEITTRTIDRYIQSLKKKGIIDRTVSNRHGEWIIKK